MDWCGILGFIIGTRCKDQNVQVVYRLTTLHSSGAAKLVHGRCLPSRGTICRWLHAQTSSHSTKASFNKNQRQMDASENRVLQNPTEMRLWGILGYTPLSDRYVNSKYPWLTNFFTTEMGYTPKGYLQVGLLRCGSICKWGIAMTIPANDYNYIIIYIYIHMKKRHCNNFEKKHRQTHYPVIHPKHFNLTAKRKCPYCLSKKYDEIIKIVQHGGRWVVGEVSIRIVFFCSWDILWDINHHSVVHPT